MSISKLTTKYQATIPKEIRKKLKIKAGDSVIFKLIDEDTVVLKKAKPLDKEYLKLLDNTLTEWESEYDEEDFKHLQNV